MSKKKFLLQIINTFEQAGNLPADLQATLEKAKNELVSKSEDEVDVETTSLVSSSHGQEHHEVTDWLSAILYQAVQEMEVIAKEREDANPELLQAYNMLRGELGMDTDPPSPS